MWQNYLQTVRLSFGHFQQCRPCKSLGNVIMLNSVGIIINSYAASLMNGLQLDFLLIKNQ